MKKASRFLIYPALIFIAACFIGSCRKSNLGPEYTGMWFSRSQTAQISISEEGHAVYGSVKDNGKDKTASGMAKLKDGKLLIGLKKITMQAPPTDVPLGKGQFNHYMVLDGDTLFKSPLISGGDFFCNDGLQNNGETGLDCGGKCAECGTAEDCEDGLRTPGEIGVDCGGACEPCEAEGCDVALDYGRNGYLSNGSATMKDSVADPLQYAGDAAHKLVLSFPAGSPCKSYELSFYHEVFLFMPDGMTEVFTSYNSSVIRKGNSCLVEVVMASGERLVVNPGKKLYVKKLGENSYNVKFCNLEAAKTGPFTLNTDFSANVNFQMHKS